MVYECKQKNKYFESQSEKQSNQLIQRREINYAISNAGFCDYTELHFCIILHSAILPTYALKAGLFILNVVARCVISCTRYSG